MSVARPEPASVAGRLAPMTWWLIIGAAGMLLYARAIVDLVRQWVTDPTTAHGVLLVAAAALVVRRRWPRLRVQATRPHVGGFALIALAMLIYIVGVFGAELFLLRLSLPLALAGVVWALAGSQPLRAILAPIGLLVLALPLPAVIVTNLTLPLQMIASQIAAALLHASGIEVVRHGNLLALHAVTLEVVDACSGLRSAQSLVAIAAMCAAVVPLGRGRGLLLLAMAVPVAVLGNGARIATTGLLATWLGDIAVRGFLHDVTGYVAFAAMCAVMGGVVLVTRARRFPQVASAAALSGGHGTAELAEPGVRV